MNILVFNSGSSSLKFQLIETVSQNVLIKGIVQRIGMENSFIDWKIDGEAHREDFEAPDHNAAIDKLLDVVAGRESSPIKSLDEIDAIGHRVVHGGEDFKESVLIDENVIKGIEECSSLAPLHNPANLMGIKACLNLLGAKVPQVAVFDTSFHSNMPDYAYLYGLPYNFYTKMKIRRYGFHGTSHKYVAQKAVELLNLDPENARIITCHLGNGASLSAVKGLTSIDTSMGLTPLEGVMMGTRTGDMDPAITLYLMETYGYTAAELNKIYNKESGVLGISGDSSDMRDLHEARFKGSKRAEIAYQVYTYRIKKYIGQYMAVLNGVDAIIFTAGIGENDEYVREDVCAGLENLGIEIDKEVNLKNNRKTGIISTPNSKVKVMIIETNEELMIAKETENIVKNK